MIPDATAAERHGVARHVSHGAIKGACAYVTGASPPKHLDDLVARLRFNEALSAVASTFIDLQVAREDADIVRGFADGTFGPDFAVQRDQVASIIARALTSLGVELPTSVTDTRFDPDGIVTRDQMASFATRLAASLIEGGFAPAA